MKGYKPTLDVEAVRILQMSDRRSAQLVRELEIGASVERGLAKTYAVIPCTFPVSVAMDGLVTADAFNGNRNVSFRD